MSRRRDAAGGARRGRASGAAGSLAASAVPVAGIAVQAWAEGPRPGWQAALAYGTLLGVAVAAPLLLRGPGRSPGPGHLLAAALACFAAGAILEAVAGYPDSASGMPRAGLYPACAAILLLPWLARLAGHSGSIRSERRADAETLLLLGISGRRIWGMLAGPGERRLLGALLAVLAAAAFWLRPALQPLASVAEAPEASFAPWIPAALRIVAVEAAAGFAVLRVLGLRATFSGGRMPGEFRAESPPEFRAGPPPPAPGGSPGVFETRPDESLSRGFAERILDDGDGDGPGSGS